MAEWTGSFGSSGSPELKVKISGMVGDGVEFTAIIDTGFTGFLSMPLVAAFPLGLLLFGTMNLVLADGSTSFRLTAYGSISVEAEKKSGIIVLEPASGEVLEEQVGVDRDHPSPSLVGDLADPLPRRVGHVWLEAPSLVLPAESEGYWRERRPTPEAGRVAGAQVHDAPVAALCRQHGVREPWTADRVFSRFQGLTVRNPLIG